MGHKAADQRPIHNSGGLARKQSELPVSVYVGALEGDSRAVALRLHQALGPEAEQTVLVAVDPGARRVEIVTGQAVRRRLDDRSAGLAALTMTSAFQAGDLSGGIANGVLVLAEHAHVPKSLHTDLPE